MMIQELCRGTMAVWLSMLVGMSLVLAFSDQLPFVMAFDRAAQKRALIGMAIGGVAEFVTLIGGGLWG